MEDEILTPAEAAKLLKFNLKTIYKLAKAGEIPAVKISKSWRFNRQALLDYSRRGNEQSPI
jgi:excisionase family DNA binding protein